MAAIATAPPGSPAAGNRPADRSGPLRRITAQGTPAVIRALLILLVVLSLAWGGFGAWAVAEHSSAANSLAHTDEPSALDAQKLYLAIADADVTITTSFLQQSQSASPSSTSSLNQPASAASQSAAAANQPASTLMARQRFKADVASAATSLAAIQGSATGPQFAGAVAAIANGLADYQGDVNIAIAEYAQSITPTGNSEMQVASEEAHLVLLPAASQLYQMESAAVTASSSQATSLPTLIVAIIVALATLFALFRAQRWLGRQTHRVFNLGLLVATAALVISGGWLIVTIGVTSADLSSATGQGATPAGELAQASIDVQQIRGDSILNVIARSGIPSLSTDSASLVTMVGPNATGAKGLLDQASAAGNAQVTSALRAAIAAAPAWYSANIQGYQYGNQLAYSKEQTFVLNNAATGFAAMKASIDNAITAAQQTFTSQANAGADAFGPLEVVVIVASLLMAAASAWGLSRRLAEYS
jgi:hypothetical protein